MEDDEYATNKMGGIKLEDGTVNTNDTNAENESKMNIESGRCAAVEGAPEETKSPSLSIEMANSNKSSKSSRQASRQQPREPPLFGHLPDATEMSCQAFQVIPDCLYGSKHLGATDNDSLDCDCRDEWRDGENYACGEDSDCINRATKMECPSDGNCGGACQNQRFQRREYAKVSVIKTEKKGYGLRSDLDLEANDFIYEYIGEVINEPTFRRRMIQYDEEGIKHFYFMSLNKSEFVDATRKGNLGRFCNHSCSPNCYVDKWVVGDKLRMGIFALRNIRAGEELVFNYNVDRYGADPQPCYCGEPNCVGFIGGKTQTERATKLPTTTVEALGIDDGEGWDTVVAKKPRRKRADEDDEDYVNSIQPRGLDEEDARKVMATLMQCKEKWIAVKLLERIQKCDEERVIHCVVRMHAYQIFRTVLNTFIEDDNLVLQVLSILDKFPRLTRNKIQDSKIEATVEPLMNSKHEDVASKAQKLLDDWSKLEVAYRIRRRKYDPATSTVNAFEERRGASAREEETAATQPKAPVLPIINAPKGPRNSQPQRNNTFGQFNGRQRPRTSKPPLPNGWFATKDASGKPYFYDKQGNTTWQRPTKPATESAVNKAAQEKLAIQNIINRVTKENNAPKPSTVRTPQSGEQVSAADVKRKKIKSLPIEKQMKIYENTIFPPIRHVLDKFRHKLPKDELKRFGKDISKKLVASDFKNKRVDDPTAELSEKQILKIKEYVKDFMNKAVVKYHGHQQHKAALEEKQGSKQAPIKQQINVDKDNHSATPITTPSRDNSMGNIDDFLLSDAENGGTPSSSDRKRKRSDTIAEPVEPTHSDIRDIKRLKEVEGEGEREMTPPPPPPPPVESGVDVKESDEKRALREQEEALMRENEEAQRLEDEAKGHRIMNGIAN